MASIINSTTTGLIVTPDNSGQLTLSANGVTALPANTTGYLNFAKQPQINGNEWPAFSAYTNSTTQSISVTTFTKILFQLEEFDTNNNFASSRFTPTVAGYYQIVGQICFGGVSTAGLVIPAVFKNGSRFKDGNACPFDSTDGSFATVNCVVYLNGSTDYVELYVFHRASSTRDLNVNDAARLYFQGYLIRAA